MDMKRFFLYFITIAALTLAGCGGGGGGTSLMVGGERATQDAIDALAASLAAAEGERDTAQMTASDLQTDLETANGSVTTLTTDLETANGMVTTLTTNLETANTNVMDLEARIAAAPMQGEVDNLQMMLTAEQTNAANLTTDLETANGMVTTLTTDLETANAMVTQLQTELDAANERLAKLDIAEDKIQAGIKSKMAEGFLASMETQNATALTVTATHKDGDVTVLVNGESDFGVSEKDPAPEAAGFTKAIVEKAADSDSSEIAAVYTDVQADGPKALLEVEEAGEAKFFSVTMVDFDMHAAADGAPGAPQAGATTTVRLGSPQTPIAGTSRLEFSGMWKGIPGTFICTANECDDNAGEGVQLTSVTDADGETTVTSNFGGRTWVFAPTDPKATVDVPDADYLWFGWWHDVPTKEDGTGDHAFRTFAGGSDGFDTTAQVNQIQLLEGNATYSGSAAGKYAQQRGSLLDPMFVADAFTATATLTAKFGADDVDGTIEGSITNFVSKSGESLAGWKVTLNPVMLGADSAAFGTGENAGNDAEEMAVAEINEVESTSGTWDGDFYGNGRSDGEPGSVAGQFRADFGAEDSVHTSIAGAYGAHNTSADE